MIKLQKVKSNNAALNKNGSITLTWVCPEENCNEKNIKVASIYDRHIWSRCSGCNIWYEITYRLKIIKKKVIRKLKFDDDGLIVAVIQDIDTKEILMVGYMTIESINKTLASKKVTFWSRSRKRLWTKGETSGNFLNLVQILVDCDGDALICLVKPDGPTCHTGAKTCFQNPDGTWRFLVDSERR